MLPKGASLAETFYKTLWHRAFSSRFAAFRCAKGRKWGQGTNSFSLFLRDIFGERSRQPRQEPLPFRSSQRLAQVRGAPHFQSRRQRPTRRHGSFPSPASPVLALDKPFLHADPLFFLPEVIRGSNPHTYT